MLDSWVRYEGQVKQRQQKELAENIIAKVQKELENPKVLQQILAQSVADVESTSITLVLCFVFCYVEWEIANVPYRNRFIQGPIDARQHRPFERIQLTLPFVPSSGLQARTPCAIVNPKLAKNIWSFVAVLLCNLLRVILICAASYSGEAEPALCKRAYQPGRQVWYSSLQQSQCMYAFLIAEAVGHEQGRCHVSCSGTEAHLRPRTVKRPS